MQQDGTVLMAAYPTHGAPSVKGTTYWRRLVSQSDGEEHYTEAVSRQVDPIIAIANRKVGDPVNESVTFAYAVFPTEAEAQTFYQTAKSWGMEEVGAPKHTKDFQSWAADMPQGWCVIMNDGYSIQRYQCSRIYDIVREMGGDVVFESKDHKKLPITEQYTDQELATVRRIVDALDSDDWEGMKTAIRKQLGKLADEEIKTLVDLAMKKGEAVEPTGETFWTPFECMGFVRNDVTLGQVRDVIAGQEYVTKGEVLRALARAGLLRPELELLAKDEAADRSAVRSSTFQMIQNSIVGIVGQWGRATGSELNGIFGNDPDDVFEIHVVGPGRLDLLKDLFDRQMPLLKVNLVKDKAESATSRILKGASPRAVLSERGSYSTDPEECFRKLLAIGGSALKVESNRVGQQLFIVGADQEGHYQLTIHNDGTYSGSIQRY